MRRWTRGSWARAPRACSPDRSLVRRASIALLISGTACYPAVTHGPRVEPGLEGSLVAAVPIGRKYENGDDGPRPFAYGPFGAGLGYGWAARADGDFGARVGFHLPVPLVVLAQPDFYVQVPRRALHGLDGGLGLTGTVPGPVLMPYAQLGWEGTRHGVYTTAGFARERNDPDRAHGVLREQAWSSTLAYHYTTPSMRSHVFATYLAGRRFWRDCPDPSLGCRQSERRVVLQLGVMLESR